MVELSIVVPTFNEIDNVVELIRGVDRCLEGVAWELIFVDDNSPDGTAERVREIARTDPRVRGIQRIGRRGLASACIEGMLSSSAPYLAVMDADLQHDESLLLDMLRILRQGDTDIVVGSRYMEGGGIGRWDKSRAQYSRFATRLSRMVLKADLSDPMSGFFMMRHDAMLRCVKAGVSGIGFKILVDLFASSPQPLRFREAPYQFRERFAGTSKLDTTVAWEYLMLLLDKLIGHIVPARFIAFSLVGGLGVLMHLAVLSTLYRGFSASFLASQTAATLVAMTSNFLMNNFLTYRDMRLTGWGLLRGWISFVLACSIGAMANVGVAAYLYQHQTFWITSAIAGVLVGTVWNYAVTAVYTWRKPQPA
ncbi:MAG: glycosyltransferase family 2 protein [Candidatus Competibacteraceae bacterium]